MIKASSHRAFAIIILFVLISAILLPRIIELDRFVTVDEPAWLIFSSNFYYALGQRDFEKTVYDYHPGVTTMWIVTAGILTYFPQFRGQGQGYIEKYRDYDQVFAAFDKYPLELLKKSRLISILTISMLLIISYGLLRRLHGEAIAFVAIFLVAFDPYFLGHSRLLNHEGMMSSLLLASMLAALVFIEQNPHWSFWVLSSFFAGLAILTKSPSIIIIPMVGLMLFLKYIKQWKELKQPVVWKYYFLLMLVFTGFICITFVILWPGMWVNPGKMLYGTFGNALSYAFQGARLSVAKELNPNQFGLDLNGIGTYFGGLVWRTTPVTWLGVLIACIGCLAKDRYSFSPVLKRSILYFGLFSVLFLLMFGIAQGRNAPHYIITSYVFLEVIAGIGIVGGFRWLGGKVKFFNRSWVITALVTSFLGIQIASAVSQFPYYYTYVNPLVEFFNKDNLNVGYGEGLEKAGEYLSQKPNARELTAISWFGYGPFSYYFSGQSIHMPPTTTTMELSLLENISQSDYLVVYDIIQKRTHRPSLLMDALTGVSPEKIIKINGLDYVSIYKVSDLPSSLFKSLNR